jgi:leucyl aminopeptidase
MASELPPDPRELLLLTENEPDEALRTAVSTSEAIASGACLARDLTTAPANQVTPSFLARTAGQLAERHGFSVKEIDYEEAGSLGMGAFRAVAKGSREPAYVTIIEHAPPDVANEPPLVLVGKGITFDSGGISLKPSDKMDAMKQDMAGAAAVLGTFEALGQLKTKRRVVGILPCTENMPDGQAYKPGDVIRTLSGITVEIVSTDAEGRLIMADVLAYSERYKPAAIVDIATLTGACITALGSQVGGLMGNHEALREALREIGMQVGEKLWPLPLWELYLDPLKSDVADFKNVGDRRGGAIAAGIFLEQFVPPGVPWAHLDIAGPAWSEKDVSTCARGATGFGVRILIELIRRWPTLRIG